MACATILFDCECDVAAFALGISRVDGIQSLQMCYDVLGAPFLLMSKALRKFPNLRSIHVEDGGNMENFSDTKSGFLSQIRDASPDLSRAVAKAVPGWRRWLRDLLNGPDGIRVTVDFWLVPPIDDALETSARAVSFSSGTQTLTGTYHGVRFSLQQQLVPANGRQEDVMQDHTGSESEVWSVVRDYFSDVKISPGAYLSLFTMMDRTRGYNWNLRNECANLLPWAIGRVLLCEGDCAIVSCINAYDDDDDELLTWLSRAKPSPEELWQLWRRILRVQNPLVLKRPYKSAYLLVDSITDLVQYDVHHEYNFQREDGCTGEVVFDVEEHFFRRLFDPTVDWMTE
ncbi:uncharacterized protein AB675_5096 [Cyphellophora attinorum]|uniref:Uncharacterized protein n=1 Tax=Cyphellophora attinorum TaxID=1664694 RepID=A0A0N0NLM2_9EURO|nr:uncharacterized protein AB675_5096 [Phialophora attinorum]KPI39471.1 hypothetical protein AB675_5096 [Phialophora attinorum]